MAAPSHALDPKRLRRLLKALAGKNAKLVKAERLGRCTPRTEPWKVIGLSGGAGEPVSADEVRQLRALGALSVAEEGYALSADGRMALRRALSGEEGFLDQHRIKKQDLLSPQEDDPARICVNLAESPLSWLANRKDRQGRAWLGMPQVKAGERLRADFTFARLMPSFSGGWRVERHSPGARQAGPQDMADDVMAARQRVDRILCGLEPTLAALLVDVCCHLKGLETVEAERGWPARSGKVVLQIALTALARRYGYAADPPRPGAAQPV